jgi:exodeoxyribonuclease V beta subunit
MNQMKPNTTDAPSASLPLIAEHFPLKGSSLIEASAGTGKTWTIAALYVRLVLGHGTPETKFERALMPADILVMTFTRAATRELSDRIRARLIESARCFRGEATPKAEDTFLQKLLADYPTQAERQHAAWRLAMAAECMDEASVHTIDAWCQRMLCEHAFDSGSLFDEELVADEQALLTQAVQDYWRRQCYGLAPQALSEVLAIWSGVDALLGDVKDLKDKLDGASVHQGSLSNALAQGRSEQQQELNTIRLQWQALEPQLRDYVHAQVPPNKNGWNGQRFQIGRITGWLDVLRAWAHGEDEAVVPKLGSGWERLTPEGLAEARSDGLMPHLPPVFAEFAGLQVLLQKLPQPSAFARRHAAASVTEQMRQLKRQQGTFGFSDLLERLHAALKGPNGERLRERIAAQYPVALIDEFQDTSPIQYGIFEQIYRTADNAPERVLLLIGDPKQSIYGFRGADIYSYLQARRATHGRHYALSVNYRSTDPLVKAVNHGFLQAEALLPAGAFQFKGENTAARGNPLPFVDVRAHGRKESWVNANGPLPAITLVHDLALQSMGVARKVFAERCAEQIVSWLNDPDNGFAQAGEPFQRLRPSDIAILVRIGKEAAALRRALQKRHVASVYLSDKDSVYQSDEARDLVHWLRAVATPQDSQRVRAALALASVGLPLDALTQLATEDEVFDAHVQTLRELRQTWLSQGVLAMLRQTLHRFGLAARWMAQSGGGSGGGERSLTNYLHLAELLQNASGDLEGEQALIRWLMNQIAENAEQTDEQVVRLESDAELVKIVTIHASKGLEYPVVCLPFATSFRGFDARFVKSAQLPLAEGGRELVLDIDDEAKIRFEQERMREDLRLLYVAMTRPRHAVWLGFTTVKVGNGKACKTQQSAIGYLLGGTDEREAADWLDPLQAWARGCDGIALVPATAPTAVSRLAARGSLPALQLPPEYQADFDRHWGIASYSRLTRDLKADGTVPTSALSPLHQQRPADDENQAETDAHTNAGADAAAESATNSAQTASASDAPAPIWHSFKRGPITGNWLHQQLDWLSAEGFALQDNASLSARLQARCERDHKDSAPALVGWLTDVVNSPLPGLNVTLAQMTSVRSEMEFWLPARQIETAAIDALCRQHLLPGVPRPRLQTSTLHGMLMGFMDLVFEHEGRYWVLDYKSNALGQTDSDFSAEHLQAEMAKHRYDVQAAVYGLALHRLLRSRLGASSDPAKHLGGAVYLFLRGIHGPAGGTCTLTLPTECLDALDAMLDPAPESVARVTA